MVGSSPTAAVLVVFCFVHVDDVFDVVDVGLQPTFGERKNDDW